MSRPLRTTHRSRRRLALAAISLALATAVLPPAGAGASSPLPGFDDVVVWSGLTNPTAISFAPDGRVFVAEKSGLVKVFSGPGDASADVFADLRTNVHNFWDRGLVGMTLDPAFPARPYVYVTYTLDAAIGATPPRWGAAGATSDPCPSPPGATADGCVVGARLSRLTASGNAMSAERVLIEDWCQQYPSHTIGDVGFGPDGALYVSGGEGASFRFVDYGQDGAPLNPCGDPPAGVGGVQSPPSAQGGALRSQDVRTTGDPVGLGGALLRVDPDTGAALPDNPMAGAADANQRRIVAYGLRNPFRFALRPGTDDVYVGDVGWDTREEVDRVPSPAAPVENFGWPCFEGPNRQAGYEAAGLEVCRSLYSPPGQTTMPLLSYVHGSPVFPGDVCSTAGDSSVTALAFYEGGSYPDAYDGALFFGDYSRDCIWTMRAGTGGVPDPATVAPFLPGASSPVDIEVGPGGDLFYVDFDGSVHRVRYASGNAAPVARATATPADGPAPLSVEFDATGSTDPDGDPLAYAWDLDGDGAYDDSTAPAPRATYRAAGTYVVGLAVTDGRGGRDVDEVTVTAGDSAPVATIRSPAADRTWAVGDVVSFAGAATDAQDGALSAGALSWSLVLHHCATNDSCHEHPLQDYPGVASGSFTAPDHDYPSRLELRLTATDSGGLTDTDSVMIDPRPVAIDLRTQPTGLRVAFGSESVVTPATRTVIEGSTSSLGAPLLQQLDGATYRFVSWSDGGDASHNVVTDAPTTFTAVYERVHRLDVATVGVGRVTSAPAGVDCGTDCSELFTAGAAVTLTATPSWDSELLSWTGACSGAAPTCTVRMDEARTAGAQFERCDVLGTAGDDVLAGTDGDDVMCGRGGNDVLSGRGGNDVLVGRGGNDVLRGGPGNDVLRGDAGIDAADYSESAVPVAVDLAATSAAGEGADELAGIEDVTGSAFADTLSGNAGANTLRGGSGNDVVTPGRGADVVSGGSGFDRVSYKPAPAPGVSVVLSDGTGPGRASGSWGDDVLDAIEHVTGSSFGDRITGGPTGNSIAARAGADVVSGLGGRDGVDGGEGADELAGGGGADALAGGPDGDVCVDDADTTTFSSCETITTARRAAR
ncbi:MAG TPA: PQQ-dependent sugar dehydrogenase [Actinomycetota bacterium]|nr:PQQ-dependent sugar dehydrogenase [Actinomycetota bacterium]